jgi:hypothetical protein
MKKIILLILNEKKRIFDFINKKRIYHGMILLIKSNINDLNIEYRGITKTKLKMMQLLMKMKCL